MPAVTPLADLTALFVELAAETAKAAELAVVRAAALFVEISGPPVIALLQSCLT